MTESLQESFIPYPEFKVVLIGPTFVGKTSIISRLFSDKLLPTEATVNAANQKYEEQFEDTKVILKIWDTAGDARYLGVMKLYTRNSSAIIAVFDVTKSDTLQFIKNWYDSSYKDIIPPPIFVVCANKIDLPHAAELTNDARNWAETNNFLYFETSALTGSQIKEMFSTLTNTLKSSGLDINSSLRIDTSQKKSHCC